MDADRWLERADARLRWRDEGTGAPLLLLHGWALDLTLFDPLVQRLRSRMRVLRFDRRGYGRSSGEPSLPADVEDGFAILDAAGVERCTVLGMSQGARVAAGMARRSPERIAAVVLDGAPALRGLADEEHEPEIPLEQYRELARRHAAAALNAALASHPLLQLVRSTPESVALLEGMLARYPAVDLTTSKPPAAPPQFARGEAAFAQPVLILNGARDSAARLRIGRRLASVLPAATRETIGDAGHLAALDDPAAYAAAITRFLDSCQVTGST